MPDHAEMVEDLTAMIADEIGDRLMDGGEGNASIPTVRDWYSTTDTAELICQDGTRFVITVRVAE